MIFSMMTFYRRVNL